MICSAGRFLSIVAASKTPAADAQAVDLSRTFPLDFIVLDELDVLLLRSGELFDGPGILQNGVQDSVAIVAGPPSYCTP